MKNIMKTKMLVLLVAVVTTFTACDTVDFGDTNIDPNSPTKASSSLFLTNIERSVAGYTATITPNLYMQYFSEGQYPESSQYIDANFSYDGIYGLLNEVKAYIKLNTDPETKLDAATTSGPNANQIAVATMLKVYFFKISLERWGMMPYSEALEGLNNPYPKFEGQLQTYKALMVELDAALNMIVPGSIQGDFMFDGDMDTWKRFGNTLKMTMALTLSKADPAYGKIKFNEALGKVIGSNAQNLMYPFLADDANDNPWQDRFQTREDYLVSDTFVNALVGAGTSAAPQDPRLPKMAHTATANPGNYVGAPYGQQNTNLNDYSFITHDIIYVGDRHMPIFTYAQVLFARSEAAALNWTTENAGNLYRAGIQASMDEWGVAPADALAYIATRPNVVNKSDIAYEKWVAMYLMGYDAWTDWRRMKAMGYEKPLTPSAIILGNATGIPNRHAYATNTANLNKDNYDAAVTAQGADDVNTVLELFQ